MHRAGLTALLTAVVTVGPANGQVFVTVPPAFTSASGTGVTSVLIAQQNSPQTTQFIYHPGQLTDLVGTALTGVTYRLNRNIPNPYPLTTTTWADYRISLGPSVLPSQRSPTFASNFTTTPTLVRSGPLTVSPFAWPAGPGDGSVPPWGVEIPFDTPYTYFGGPLAIYFTHPGSNNPDFGNALNDSTSAVTPNNGVDFTRVWQPAFGATSGSFSDFTVILRFTVTPVPEPGTALTLGAVAVAAAWWRRTSRHRANAAH